MENNVWSAINRVQDLKKVISNLFDFYDFGFSFDWSKFFHKMFICEISNSSWFVYQMRPILNFSLTVDSGGLLRVCAFWLSWSPDLFLILLKLWKCVCLAALISCSLFGLRLPLLELSVPFFGLKKLRGKSRSTNRRDWAVFEGFLRTSKRSSRGFRSSNLQLKKLSTKSHTTIFISKNICGTVLN